MHGDKLNGRELLLVFRKENPEVHRDLDPDIGLSSLRLVDPGERRVVLVARKPVGCEPIKKGESVQGFLFLAPAGGTPEMVKQNTMKLTKCRSMHELKNAGCQLLEGPFSISD
jgi:hypothetical protein